MFADPWFVWAPVLISTIPVVVVTVLAYLVLRFGIRDGLRAHHRWLDRHPAPPGGSDAGEPPADAR